MANDKNTPTPQDESSPEHPRVDVYRYVVDIQKADLTPLAHVEAFLGQEKLQVLNISQGGLALLVQESGRFSKGDHIDLSLSIREKHFPVQTAVKNAQSCRLSCAFIDPSPNFQQALREFLKAKYLGTTLKKNVELSQDTSYRSLVENATQLEVYAGENQTGVFVWMGHNREIKKFLAISQDFVMEWAEDKGLKTGKVSSDSVEQTSESAQLEDQFQWDRVPADSLKHHFADILLAWMDVSVGADFVKNLMSENTQNKEIKFPKIS